MLELALSMPLHLNEIRLDSPPPLTDVEYVELQGEPGTPLAGYCLACVDETGVLTGFLPLWGKIQDDGFLVASGSIDMYNVDLIAELGLPDAVNATVFLVKTDDYVSPGTVVDANLDGAMDQEYWTEVDSLAVRWSPWGHVYSDTIIGDGDGFVIYGAQKCPDTGNWAVLPSAFSETSDTPHEANPPCGGWICFGDLNGDLQIGSGDLSIVLGSYGQSFVPADLDQSGVVDAGDIAIILGSWGPCEL